MTAMQLVFWMTPNKPELWFFAGVTTNSPAASYDTVARMRIRRGSFIYTSLDSLPTMTGRSKQE